MTAADLEALLRITLPSLRLALRERYLIVGRRIPRRLPGLNLENA
jgi:hypothetical protein